MFVIAIPAVTGLSPSLAQRMALIIAGLCQAVAVRGARNRAMQPATILIWTRLRRMVARFDALVARARAGSQAGAPVCADPPAPASHPPAAGALGPGAAAVRSPRRLPHRLPHRLPRGFAWLIRLVPEAAVYGSQVQHLLGDPELAALLAAEPKLGRILRPLCRMLAIRPGPDLPAGLHRTEPPPHKPAPRQPQSGGRPADAPGGALSAAVRPAARMFAELSAGFPAPA